MKSYYEILGVSEDATQYEIKKAYRKLSKKHHPDAGGDPELFREILNAYETLMDPEKREEYDKYGEPAGYGDVVKQSAINLFKEIMSERPDDIQRTLMEKIKEAKSNCADLIDSCREEISRLEKIMKRIIKSPKIDVLGNYIKDLIEAEENKIKNYESASKMIDNVSEFLKDYEFEKEPDKPRRGFHDGLSGGIYITTNLLHGGF